MDDNGQTTTIADLEELDGINRHVVILTSAGMAREAVGAGNAWLDRAIRVAVKPAATQDAAELKIRILAGNMYGWALQASRENGLVGAFGLIMGAVGAEARDWGIEMPEDLDACDVAGEVQGSETVFDPGVLSGYRQNAKRRRFGPAIKRYEAIVAEIDARFARGEGRDLVEGVIHRSREALLDCLAVSAPDLANLERKQRAYLDSREVRGDPRSWLFSAGASMAFETDYLQLRLPAVEVARLKATFEPIAWRSDGAPVGDRWAHRHDQVH